MSFQDERHFLLVIDCYDCESTIEKRVSLSLLDQPTISFLPLGWTRYQKDHLLCDVCTRKRGPKVDRESYELARDFYDIVREQPGEA